MGLLELKTNLKSLKYEGIEKPLITKDINNPPNTGGIAMQVNHRIDDVARLGKLMTKKQGLKFLGNQALLAQTNIKQDIAAQKNKSAKAIAKAIGKRLKETAIDTVLATASIIAQAPLNGTGAHIPRGIKPSTYLKSGNQGGIATLAAPDGTIIPNNGPNGPADGGSFQVSDDYQVTSLGDTGENKFNNGQKWQQQFGQFVPSQGNDYLNTRGNPSGKVKAGNKAFPDNNGIAPGNDNVKGGSQLKDRESTSEITVKPVKTQPARAYKQRPKVSSDDTPLIKEINIDETNNTYTDRITKNGVQATDDSREKREERSSREPLKDKPDPIQSLALDTAEITSAAETDIIPFTFNVWTPGDAEGKFIYFRAFLDSFSDNFTGAWNSNKFIGRGDNLLTYGGFERGISFGFKVAAFSKADIKPLYEKLNHLVGSTAPSYSGEGTFMKGTFVSLTVGDYIVRQSGVIESISLTWQTTYPWELTGDENTKRVPHVLDVAVTFKPIHSFVPQVAGQFIYQDA